jgi:sphingomyelin phosphodiesterase 3
VGYIANLHTQAFQGKEPAISTQLSESLDFINKFQETSRCIGDNVMFDVVCGDFNADNMSPGESINFLLHFFFIDAQMISQAKTTTKIC